MITQSHISKSLDGLQDRFRKKYGLTEYLDSSAPLVIFGMYNPEDVDVLLSHKGKLTIVWQGCDAKDINPMVVGLIKRRTAKHYSISHWIKESLEAKGIDSELKPISATQSLLKRVPRGDKIYFYSSDLSPESAEYYGESMIEEIRNRTGLEVIRATMHTYSSAELLKVYRDCFINLRLTTFDGCPNTNLEMGMMGRRSIFNGNIPHSIKWIGPEDICESIMQEYSTRHEDNSQISKDVVEFINIPNKIFL